MDRLSRAQVDEYLEQGYTLLRYSGRLSDLPSLQAAAMREYAHKPGQYLIKDFSVIGPLIITLDEDTVIDALEKAIILLKQYKEQKLNGR